MDSCTSNYHFPCCFKSQKPKSTCLRPMRFLLERTWREGGEKKIKRDLKPFLSLLQCFTHTQKFHIKSPAVSLFLGVNFLSSPPLPGAMQLRISCQAVWLLLPNSVLLYASNLDFYCWRCVMYFLLAGATHCCILNLLFCQLHYASNIN